LPFVNDSAADLDARLELAVAAARAAGDSTLQRFHQRNFCVERKSDRSPVTEADRQAEMLLRERILASFPRDAVLGEEFGEQPGDSGFRWILDPIDGTKSFISGVPLYGTLVGVEHAGRSILGVIYSPALDECVYAGVGRGAWYATGNQPPVPARVSSTAALSAGLFVTSQVSTFAARGAAAAFHDLEQAACITRTWGDCYGYLLVATGRAEVMIDPMLNIWDAAAIQPILEEAGGTFTDWQGRATIHGGEAIGSNGRVLEQVLEITRRFPVPW
jgi:histidinol-phosphatase